MRGTGNHIPPVATQIRPEDNTSADIRAQVGRWMRDQLPTSSDYAHSIAIHTESAREIAAWFQAPDNAFSAFASTGTITDGFAEEIDEQVTEITERQEGRESVPPQEDRDSIDALRALLAYVKASKVTVWSVGKNTAGYLPEADVYTVMDYADALRVYRDMLISDAPEDVARTDECTCTDDKTCEMCTVDAYVASYIRDEIDCGPAGRGDHVPLGTVIDAKSWSGSMSYWLQPDVMVYGEYLDQVTDSIGV